MSFYRRYGSLTLVLALHALALICLLLPARAAQRPPAPAPMWLLASIAPAPMPPQKVSPPAPASAKPQRPIAARAPQALPSPVKVPVTVSDMHASAAIAVAESSPPSAAAPAAAAAAPARQAEPQPPALTPPAFNAAYLNNPAPAYPPLLRRAGEQGRVLLRVFVNPDGRADEVRILNSSGQSLFDQAAIEAVRKWRFVPARRGEAVVAEWVQVPIEFKLG